MTFLCGYCKVDQKHPPRKYFTWDDLIDHLMNAHRFRLVENKLVRR